jgi:flagellar basal body-associated protein FliL
VTARISAALRAAPTAPSHTTARPRSSRSRTILLLVGIAAAAAGITVAVALLLHTTANPRFPSGPTAEKITVSTTPADTPKAVVTPP